MFVYLQNITGTSQQCLKTGVHICRWSWVFLIFRTFLGHPKNAKRMVHTSCKNKSVFVYLQNITGTSQ